MCPVPSDVTARPAAHLAVARARNIRGQSMACAALAPQAFRHQPACSCRCSVQRPSSSHSFSAAMPLLSCSRRPTHAKNRETRRAGRTAAAPALSPQHDRRRTRRTHRPSSPVPHLRRRLSSSRRGKARQDQSGAPLRLVLERLRAAAGMSRCSTEVEADLRAVKEQRLAAGLFPDHIAPFRAREHSGVERRLRWMCSPPLNLHQSVAAASPFLSFCTS
jgi:hypothetical protein